MKRPLPVLFPLEDKPYAHTEALQAIFAGKEIPEGGPFCVCSPKAILTALRGFPVACDDLPWSCPFGLAERCAPTV